jgi:hypothetical protein
LTGAIAGSGPGATAVLSELHASHRFPVPMVVGFQVLDTVVHTWDLAVALGGDHRPTPDLIALVNQIALEVPGGASREEPGAAFRPALDAASDDRWDQTLALLGRRPAAPIGGAA